MATMEPGGLKSYEHYDKFKPQRKNESELTENSIYAFLGRFSAGPIEALRLPVSVEIPEPEDVRFRVGRAIVNITLLNVDLKPFSENRGSMQGGIWQPDRDDPFTMEYDNDRQTRMVEGYLLDYDDGMGRPIIEQVEGIRSPQELVSTGHFRI